jgi:hypothetical protein
MATALPVQEVLAKHDASLLQPYQQMRAPYVRAAVSTGAQQPAEINPNRWQQMPTKILIQFYMECTDIYI